MKSMKLLSKIFLSIFLIVLSVSLVACDNADKIKTNLDSKNPVQITLWHYYSDENKILLEEMIDEFNQTIGLEKGIVVEPIAQGAIMDLETAITSSAKGDMNSQKMPNIFSSYIDKAVELDSMGKIVDLNEYLTDEDKANYYQPYIESSLSADGKMLIVPVLKSTEILYINDTDLEKFLQSENLDINMLNTWEGVEELSRIYHESKLLSSSTNPESAGALFGIDELANFIVIGMKQQGVDVINYDIKGALLDKSALRKIFDFYVKNNVNGNFCESGKYRTDNVKTGDILAYIGSSSGSLYFPSNIEVSGKSYDIDLKVLPYPHFKDGENYSIQQGAGMAVVKSTEEEIEASLEFLKWFTSYEQNTRMAMKAGYLPVAAEAYKEGRIKEKLEDMKTKDIQSKNTTLVFEVGIKQMMSNKSYASKPFTDSYTVRTTLKSTLQEINDMVLEQSKIDGQNIDYDKYFDEWIKDIKDHLDKSGIPYEVVN